MDDHEEYRELLRRHLADSADDFILSSNGTEAVEIFDRCHPSWAVIDWVMPVLDGLETIRRIIARHPGAQLVLTSVFSLPLLVREAKTAGAIAFVPKDQMAELKKVLSELPPTSVCCTP